MFFGPSKNITNRQAMFFLVHRTETEHKKETETEPKKTMCGDLYVRGHWKQAF